MDTSICYDWLLVFFIHEADGYTGTWDTIVNQIEAMGPDGPDSTNCIYLIKDHLKLADNPRLPGSVINVFCLTVERLGKNAAGQWEFLPEKVHIDNQNRRCWKTAFDYVYRNVRAKRRVLACFSHGAAFGINVDTDPDRREPFQLKISNTSELILDSKAGINKIAEISSIIDFSVNPAPAGGQAPAPAPGPPPAIKDLSNSFYVLDNSDIAGIKNILEASDADKNSAEYKEMMQDLDNGRIPKSKIDSLCKALEILWISDLADALRQYLGTSRIDLLLMNNCYMQNFDTGFLLKDNVEYIVAAEGWLNASGYDYPALLARMKADPAVPGAELARGVIADYEKLYANGNMSEDLEQQAVFANDISLYPRALVLFNQLLDVLEKNMTLLKADLVAIRENQISYVSCPFQQYTNNYLCMVDALQWVELVIDKLLQHNKDAFGCTPLLAQFRDVKAKIVIQGRVGKDYVDHDNANALGKYGYSGLSIFYPTREDRAKLKFTPWCAYFGKQIKGDWETKWMRFLNKYYL